MSLYRLQDFYQNYSTVQSFDFYTETGTHIGAVEDILVDEDGRFRYLVLNSDRLQPNQRLLLQLRQFRIEPETEQVYVELEKIAIAHQSHFPTQTDSASLPH